MNGTVTLDHPMNGTRPLLRDGLGTLEWIKAGLLLILTGAVLVHIFYPTLITTTISGLCLILFIIIEFAHIARMAQVLVFLCIGLIAYEYAKGSFDPKLIATAFDRAAFMTFFLNSIGFLQFAAKKSPLLLRSGQILVQQPPGRRYSVLTFGAALFGMLINLSTIGLLGSMISQGAADHGDDEERRIASIRRKRMTLAMLRGFCSIPMWSPITVTIAIITSAIPTLRWAEIAVYSAPLAVVFIAVGWMLDRLAYPKRPAPVGTVTPSLAGLIPLLILALAVPAFALTLSSLLHTSMIIALLIVLPWLSIGWLILQKKGLSDPVGKTADEVTFEILPSLASMRSEITLFSGSAFLGVMVAHIIDTDALGAAIIGLGLPNGIVLAVTAWIMVTLSVLGINSIVTVTIAAATMPKLTVLAIDPVIIGMMLVSVWCITVNLSPYSTAVRLSARIIDTDPLVLGGRWNGVYALMCLCLLTLCLMVLA